MLSGAYGISNAAAKWQELSDDLLRSFGLLQSVQLPQLFYLKSEGKLVVAALKVVDNIMFSGKRVHLSKVIGEIAKSYKLGTIVYGTGQIQFYRLMVTQLEDMTVIIDGCIARTIPVFPHIMMRLHATWALHCTVFCDT